MLVPQRTDASDVRIAARRLAPFALCGLVAFALVPFSGAIAVRWPEVAIAFAITSLLGVLALLKPSLTEPRHADAGALVALVAIALLRDGTGGARGGYGITVMVPVLWVALYGTRPQLWRLLFAVALMFTVPLVAIGEPRYAATGWRSVPLTLLASTLVGVVVQELLARERQSSDLVQAEHARSTAILSSMREGFALTRDGVIVDVNPALTALTGFTRDELIGARTPFPFWPLDQMAALQRVRAQIKAERGGTFETTFRRADGSRFVAEVTAVPVPQPDDGSTVFLNTMRDVTERRAAEQAMEERGEQLAQLATVTRVIAHANPDDARETVCGLALRISNATTAQIRQLDETDDPDARRAIDTRTAVFLPTGPHGADAELFQPILDEGRAIGVLALTWTTRKQALDASETHLLELLANEAAVALVKASAHAELERLVRTDPLTGLPNRRALEEHHERELAAAARSGRPLCLAIIDLDRFKDYNDTYGHPAGDALLRAAAAGWSARLRATDVLARWGGEEFCLLLPGCDEAGACALIEQLRPVVPQGQTFSAGVALWTPGVGAEQLIAQADAALYRAKRDGRNRTATALGARAA
ncbi:diguanylate cyclase [Conexibacter sp. JD483]|uniref:GGDEF domain-containing protein n=1 Tax=unclassified Conexibacter TaxID=2627773 RepID=UPI0027223E61|nr:MULTISPECIES: diguanylate cyclase [unclassified Conexibacter]MDO8189010.1 diguanylate cyclase [Conexibacter sp. CPCC 205706]MDO8201410.1 diguanylate cyclase [Conexibacter sp. CPCC 205762]MDR9371703.1 diguanylate cyclase [Conexibacter sp. JD483]